MPRSKYTKAPGPPPIARIARDAFRFDDDEQRDLVALLPLRFKQLGVPESFKVESFGAAQFETMAELIVAYTQEQIQCYLAMNAAEGGAPTNPANVGAAIRNLRAALRPFVAGWVDSETATIISDDLDRRLAERERELAGMRLPPIKRRKLGLLCQSIGVFLKACELENQVTFEERDAIRYVAMALDRAGIEHSYSTENPSRFAALVFPKS